MRALWAGLMGTALQRRLNLAAAVTGNAANIANAAATGGHLPNQPVCIGTATPIVKVVVTNKLPATVLAQVFLLVVAGFAVSLYILSTATGTANGNLNLHNSNIPCLRCFLFALRLSAYILGHHRAQGLCLEEMTGQTISEGALWYMQTRHRVPVVFSDDLRAQTLATIAAVRKTTVKPRRPTTANAAKPARWWRFASRNCWGNGIGV